MHNHQQLDVWQESRRFVAHVYSLTRAFPSDERFGLASQLRRASVSIPSNIAEGAGRGGDRSFAQFLRIASGSASETETQLQIARDLDFGATVVIDAAIGDVRRIRKMLWGLEQHYSNPG
ncbi:MAG: four helix bundle protein [Actinomycetota bacterium]|nr:four helix bundle protein [Actinomycetota bacterium]